MKADSKVVLGLLAGAAIGAIAGILFAPDKGSETRKKISKTTSDMGEQLKSSFSDFVDSVKEKYRVAKTEAEEAAEKGASKISNIANQAKNSVV